ncbi:hypothetical protein ACOSQ2_017005 [Xanthoceras sorbifolium]
MYENRRQVNGGRDEEQDYAYSHESDNGTPPHPRDLRALGYRVRDTQRGFNAKVEIPEFEGKSQSDEFVEWLNTVDRIFDYQDVPENKKVKLVAIKLRKHASFWWENLKRQREREGEVGSLHRKR